MSGKKVLYHVSFQRKGRFLEDAMIIIQDEKIVRIIEEYSKEAVEEAKEAVDMQGMVIYPAWIDSHLHIPGKLLYEINGVDLSSGNSMEEYTACLDKHVLEKGWLRGYGWNALYMNQHLGKMKEYLSNQYHNTPVLLFSDDFHSCICNAVALEKMDKMGICVHPDSYGVLHEKDIFVLNNELPYAAFTEEEMEKAILQYQEFLLKRGITAVQTLMFLGGNADREWKVLHDLDCRGLLKLKVNLALTILPFEPVEGIGKRFEALQKYETAHIKVQTVKIYMDGVVESKTAGLEKPYEGSLDVGDYLWENDLLHSFCRQTDKKGIQIHIHAIGDGAVHQAVEALVNAMEENHTRGLRRHVITHLQLINDSDVAKMAEYGIIASLQPYWFPQKAPYYSLDYRMLGERANTTYKAGTLVKAGVLVTGSSDSPVTPNPNPLLGIQMAMSHHRPEERLSFDMACKAFTMNGAYQLWREKELGMIEEGYYADLIGFPERLTPENVKNAKLCFVMANGEIQSID